MHGQMTDGEAIQAIVFLAIVLPVWARYWWFSSYFERRKRRKEILAKIAEGKSCTFDVLEVDLY